MALVDVVVVAYESRRHLRACTAPLANFADVTVTVVDNASTDGGPGSLAGLDVELLVLAENRGFAAGCNVGWRAGSSPYVLLLNPDVRIEEHALRRLAQALDEHRGAAGVGPMILGSDRTPELSQGRFPSLARTYARAFFLHRLLPTASWSDIFVRDEVVYARPGRCDWATGACLLLRRIALEQVGGLDERFFLYCEDVDLCFRLRRLGWDVRYEPDAVVEHHGDAWAVRPDRLPHLAAGRARYARKHHGPVVAGLEIGGIRLETVTRLIVSRGGLQGRLGHARSLTATFRRNEASGEPRESGP